MSYSANSQPVVDHVYSEQTVTVPTNGVYIIQNLLTNEGTIKNDGTLVIN